MVESISLPPRSSALDDSEERQFRTGLSLSRYVKLTNEALQRGGMTVYQLTRLVMSLYVDKQLVPVKDLPSEIQQAIKEHYASL